MATEPPILHQQFLIDVRGTTPDELQAALSAAGTALGSGAVLKQAAGVNFIIRRGSRYRKRDPRPDALSRSMLGSIQLAATCTAIGFAVAAWLSSTSDRHLQVSPAVPALMSAPAGQAPSGPAARSGTRRAYAYSVVPGGVTSRAELTQVVASDRVVASHYAGFDVSAALVEMSPARAVHVSYRKGDKIYWTRRKIMLKAGEAILNDGTHQIRTRCGNRISETAQLPVADDEPSADALDEFNEDEGSATPQIKVEPRPYAKVPEPGSLWLMGAGLGLLAAVRRSRRNHRHGEYGPSSDGAIPPCRTYPPK